MSNETKESKEGYSAGQTGVGATENPYSRNVFERSVDLVLDVMSGGIANISENADRKEAAWEGGRKAGKDEGNK